MSFFSARLRLHVRHTGVRSQNRGKCEEARARKTKPSHRSISPGGLRHDKSTSRTCSGVRAQPHAPPGVCRRCPLFAVLGLPCFEQQLSQAVSLKQIHVLSRLSTDPKKQFSSVHPSPHVPVDVHSPIIHVSRMPRRISAEHHLVSPPPLNVAPRRNSHSGDSMLLANNTLMTFLQAR